MKSFFLGSILLCFGLSTQAQLLDDWTIWMAGVRMDLDSACSVKAECNDADPLSRDYCDGEYCIHSRSRFNAEANFKDIDVDQDGNVWITHFHSVSRFDGTSWTTFNSVNSDFGSRRPIENTLLFNTTIAPDGRVAVLSEGNEFHLYDGRVWRKEVFTDTSLISTFLGTSTSIRNAEFAPNGDLWLTTDRPDGLAVWDSSSWTVFTDFGGNFTNRQVRAIDFAEDGTVWAATDGRGVFSYDGNNWTEYNTSNSNIPDDDFWDLIALDGKLWGIASAPFGRQLAHFDGTDWVDPYFGTFIAPNRSLTHDQQGQVIVPMLNAFARFDGNSWQITDIDTLGITSSTVDQIALDSMGLYWLKSTTTATNNEFQGLELSTYDGLNLDKIPVFKPGSTRESQTPNGDILFSPGALNWTLRYKVNEDQLVIDSSVWSTDFSRYGVQDTNGHYWRAVADGPGVERFDGSGWQVWNNSNSNLPNLAVNGVYIMPDGGVWIRMVTQGVAYFNGFTWDVYTISNSDLSSGSVRGITQGIDGTMIFAHRNGALDFFNGQTWKRVDPSNNNNVDANREHQFAIEDTSDFWYCSDGAGAFHYQNGVLTNFSTSTMPNSVPTDALASMVRLNNGDLWFSKGFDGIITFNNSNWGKLSFESLPIPNDIIFKLFKDEQDNIWMVGTSFLAKARDNTADLVYSVSAETFYDQNLDGQKDSLDTPVPYQKLKLQPAGSLYFSDSQGEFYALSSEGQHTLTVLPDPLLQTVNGIDSYTFTLDSLNASRDDFPFPLRYEQSGSDLLVESQMGMTRCSWASRISIQVKNQGSATISMPSVQLIIDPGLSFDYANPSPSQQNGDTLIWQLMDMIPTDIETIEVFTSAIAGAIGDTFFAEVSLPGLNDSNTENNQSSCYSLFICSFDPNDKLAVPIGKGENNEIPLDQELTYTIRFQNTGNDTAFQVVLLDTVDHHFSLESLYFLSSSHTFEPYFLPGRTLKLVFDNILLPDSATNPLGSQGYIQYRISPNPNLLSGTQVNNRAAIFFDTNEPIITNTVSHTYQANNTSLEASMGTNYLRIYPNPVSDQFQIELASQPQRPIEVQLMDIQGRSLARWSISQQSSTFNRQHIPAGIYFLQIVGDDHSTQKVIFK